MWSADQLRCAILSCRVLDYVVLHAVCCRGRWRSRVQYRPTGLLTCIQHAPVCRCDLTINDRHPRIFTVTSSPYKEFSQHKNCCWSRCTIRDVGGTCGPSCTPRSTHHLLTTPIWNALFSSASTEQFSPNIPINDSIGTLYTDDNSILCWWAVYYNQALNHPSTDTCRKLKDLASSAVPDPDVKWWCTDSWRSPCSDQ